MNRFVSRGFFVLYSWLWLPAAVADLLWLEAAAKFSPIGIVKQFLHPGRR